MLNFICKWYVYIVEILFNQTPSYLKGYIYVSISTELFRKYYSIGYSFNHFNGTVKWLRRYNALKRGQSFHFVLFIIIQYLIFHLNSFQQTQI